MEYHFLKKLVEEKRYSEFTIHGNNDLLRGGSFSDISELLRLVLRQGVDEQKIKVVYLLLKRLSKEEHFRYSNLEPFIQLFFKFGELSLICDLHKSYSLAHKPNALVEYNLAYILSLLARFRESIKHYEMALELNISKPEEILVNLANIYGQGLSEPDLAQARLEEALKKDPNYVPAHINLGNLYEGLGEHDKAIKSFTKALELDEKDYYSLSRLMEINNANIKAHDLAKHALESNINEQDKLDLEFAFARVYDNEKSYETAANYLTKANKRLSSFYPPYNPVLVETTTEKILHQRLPEIQHSNDRLLFICGMFRSGSTLLEQILAKHPSVESMGEVCFFPNQFGNTLSKFSTKYGELSKTEIETMLIHHQSLIRTNSEFSRAKFIIDKRPDNIFYMPLIKRMYPKAKIIITDRELKDNALSILFQQLGPNFNYANSVTDINHYYSCVQKLIKYYMEIYDQDIMVVHYESVVTNFTATVQKIFRFLELDWDPEVANFHLNKRLVMTASMSQVKKPIHQGSIGRWKNYAHLFDIS